MCFHLAAIFPHFTLDDRRTSNTQTSTYTHSLHHKWLDQTMMYSVPCYNSAVSIRFLLLPCTICLLRRQLDFSEPFCVSNEQNERISVELHYHYATSSSLATYSSKDGTQGPVYLRSNTGLMNPPKVCHYAGRAPRTPTSVYKS